MKRQLIPAIIALFSASAAVAGGPEMVIMAPSPFDGFYLGGNVSFNHTGFDIDSDTALITSTVSTFTTLPQTALDGGDSSTDAYYGIRGGWGRVYMNRWYGGIEGFASFGNANGNIDLDTFNFGDEDEVTASVDLSGHIGTQYGVAGRLGVLLSPTTLAYAKLGAVWASVKASVDAEIVNEETGLVTELADGSSSNTEAAFLWGFGVEQFIYKNAVSLFAEFTYASFGTTTNTVQQILTQDAVNPNIFTAEQTTTSVSADVSTFTGGLNFHFGRDWI